MQVATKDRNKTPEAEIFVKIDGEVHNISADTFFKVTKGMFDVLKEVDKAANEGQTSVKWEITDLKKASATLRYGAVSVLPGPPTGELVATAIINGLRSIQSRISERPQYFTNDTLKKLRGIISNLPPKENKLLVGDAKDPIILTMDAVAQIDEWTAMAYTSIGSIEGRLENVASHGNRNQCAIYNDMGQKIDCFFALPLKEDIKRYLFDKIAVRGLVHYTYDGSPLSIRATQIQKLPDDNELPPLRSLMGTLELEATSDSYLEELHGE